MADPQSVCKTAELSVTVGPSTLYRQACHYRFGVETAAGNFHKRFCDKPGTVPAYLLAAQALATAWASGKKSSGISGFLFNASATTISPAPKIQRFWSRRRKPSHYAAKASFNVADYVPPC